MFACSVIGRQENTTLYIYYHHRTVFKSGFRNFSWSRQLGGEGNCPVWETPGRLSQHLTSLSEPITLSHRGSTFSQHITSPGLSNNVKRLRYHRITALDWPAAISASELKFKSFNFLPSREADRRRKANNPIKEIKKVVRTENRTPPTCRERERCLSRLALTAVLKSRQGQTPLRCKRNSTWSEIL